MELEGLIEGFSQSRYNELSIEKGDQSIYLKKSALQNITNIETQDSDLEEELSETLSEDLAKGDFIKSPRVGIFSSNVKSGDKIKKGDKVGVITAMNVPHDLCADQDGTIKSVLVESGIGVAFGVELIELEVGNI